MRRSVLCVLLPALLLVPAIAPAMTGEKAELQKLAEGVYAFVGKLNDANAMAIVTTQGVIVVDTGNNPPETRILLKDIQSVTAQPALISPARAACRRTSPLGRLSRPSTTGPPLRYVPSAAAKRAATSGVSPRPTTPRTPETLTITWSVSITSPAVGKTLKAGTAGVRW